MASEGGILGTLLWLWWRKSGCSAAWWRRWSCQALSILLHQIGNLCARLVTPLGNYPIRLWGTSAALWRAGGDLRAQTVVAAAEHFYSVPECCLDSPLSLKVRSRSNSASDFLTSPELECLSGSAADVVCLNLDLERMQVRR
jgi:hypothetical protein